MQHSASFPYSTNLSNQNQICKSLILIVTRINSYTSVSEWKYIIVSAFKFKLLHQPALPINGGGSSQLGGNLWLLVDIFQLALLRQPALTIMGEAQASWVETSGAWWIFLLSYVQAS